MSEDLEERVSYLEREVRRQHHLMDAAEKRTDVQVRDVNTHLDRQDKALQDFKESVNKRFEHVYGELADLKANTVEMRDILATLVQRQDQHSELLKQILAKLG